MKAKKKKKLCQEKNNKRNLTHRLHIQLQPQCINYNSLTLKFYTDDIWGFG